ncbi:uncharacterized protein LOC144442912 [Glandiceps talaboti]
MERVLRSVRTSVALTSNFRKCSTSRRSAGHSDMDMIAKQTSTLRHFIRACSTFVNSKTKVLYDGDCPLCLKEINILKYVDKNKRRIKFIDVTKPDYNPQDNCNISYEQAMGVMHVIGPENQIYTKVEAMRQMYSAVGLGWLWSFTKLPILSGLVDRAYMWFARNRLSLTGRQLECRTGTCKVGEKVGEKENS